MTNKGTRSPWSSYPYVVGGVGNMSEYSITKDAKSLSPIIQSLFDWVEKRSKN
ncbi:MAG: hypothetical protein ACJZ5B_05330 [Candidatus Poseidoniaceae archaeon]